MTGDASPGSRRWPAVMATLLILFNLPFGPLVLTATENGLKTLCPAQCSYIGSEKQIDGFVNAFYSQDNNFPFHI